jgi:hypothetical protein
MISQSFTVVRISMQRFWLKIESICHEHGGTQKMVIQGDVDLLVIPLELAGYMIHLKQNYQQQKNSTHSSNVA